MGEDVGRDRARDETGLASMTLRDLLLRVRAIVRPRRVDRELDDELAFHVERETAELIAQGCDPVDARVRARARFGSMALAADGCRDARGTGLIDSLRQDVRFALTTFRRAPLSALTVVVTVALGLGLVGAVFTGYSAFFLRADAVTNPDEIFEVRRPPEPGNTRVWDPFVPADYEALRRNTQVLTDAAATVANVDTRITGLPATGTLVTANFFQVLGARAQSGRTLGPGDDGRAALILSHRGWVRLFASDPSVVGTTVNVAGEPFVVAGVMSPAFAGEAVVTPDFWAPLGWIGRLRPSVAGSEDRVALDVIARLRAGVSVETATAALTAWAAADSAMAPTGHFPKTIWLKPLGVSWSDAARGLQAFAPLFVVFGLILFVACANVANLLLARGVARQREIGIRLSMGASRRRIVRQLLTESLLLSLVSAALAFELSELFVKSAAYAVSAMAPSDLAVRIGAAGLGVDWRLAIFLAAGALLSTALFGLAPALHTTRVDLIRAMRGELLPDVRPGRAPRALIAFQVTASSLLAIGAAVFLRSAFVAEHARPTVRIDDTVLLSTMSEPARASVLQTVRDDPAVERVAASQPAALSRSFGELAEATLLGPDSTPISRNAVDYKFVSPGYFALLEIQLLRGRVFGPTEVDEQSGVAVVSESTARRLWQSVEVVGQKVRLNAVRTSNSKLTTSENPVPTPSSRTFLVIGVVKDATAGQGMFELHDAGLYLPARADSAGMSLVMRLRGDPEAARQQLGERLLKVDPAVGTITSLRSMAGRAVFLLRLASAITFLLGGLALAITLSAVFGVLSYLVNRRVTEFGVRMSLGATSRDITRLVLGESMWSVVGGTLAGAMLAILTAEVLRALTVLAPDGGVIRVFDPMAYALSMVGIVAACAVAASIPAWHASRIDPATALRQE